MMFDPPLFLVTDQVYCCITEQQWTQTECISQIDSRQLLCTVLQSVWFNWSLNWTGSNCHWFEQDQILKRKTKTRPTRPRPKLARPRRGPIPVFVRLRPRPCHKTEVWSDVVWDLGLVTRPRSQTTSLVIAQHYNDGLNRKSYLKKVLIYILVAMKF